MEAVLQDVYLNVNNPYSFTSVERVYKAAHARHPDITRDYVKQWLHTQDTYTLNKPAKKRFKRSRLISPGLFIQSDIDLADVSNLAKANDGIRWLLVAIDSLSRKLYIEPLKSKKAVDVIGGLEKLWGHDPKPKVIRSDSGPEFTNKKTQSYFKDNGIHHFTTHNSVKAHMAERVIRTFRARLHRLITYNQNERYIDDLNAIVHGYNESVHSSIGLAPNDVTYANERSVWWTLFWPKKPRKTPKPYKFKVNDLVRISYARHPFSRGYDYQYTGEVFKVVSRARRDLLPVYKLHDLSGEPLSGTFYTEELVLAPHGDVYKVEKILRTRKRPGYPKEAYVKWLHFGPKFNSWVKADTLVDI
jgi:hypothetical protein